VADYPEELLGINPRTLYSVSNSFSAEDESVGDWGTAVAAATAFIGLMVGYFMGYRSGMVLGELKAIKSSRDGRHRHRPKRAEAPADAEPS
jgi:hypothetical protein